MRTSTRRTAASLFCRLFATTTRTQLCRSAQDCLVLPHIHILCPAPTREVDVWVVSDNAVPVWPLTSLPPPSRRKKHRFHGFFHPISDSPLATWQSHEAAPQRESDSSLSLSPASGLSSSTGKSVSLITLGNCIFSPAYLPNAPPGAPLSSARSEFSPKGGGAE